MGIDDKTLFERGSIKVGVSTKIPTGAEEMLRNMTVGSHGAQYHHKNVDERLVQTKEKYFLYMKQSEKLKATVTTALRRVKADFGMVNAYYVRYFLFSSNLQASSEKRIKHGKDGFLKRYFKKFMSVSPATHGVGYGEDLSLPSFFYAYFDAENYRSTELSQILGLSPVGEFDTFAFTRLHPKKNSKVERLEPVHYPGMAKILDKYYNDYSLYNDMFLFVNDGYFVWRENGEVVAGVQANKCEWELKKMSGVTGLFMLKILPNLPGIKRYINPKNFEFITFDYLYVKPGHEDKLEKLFASLLNEYGVTFSLLWQDLKSPLHPVVSNLDKGLLSNFSKVPTGRTMMTLSNISEDQVSLLMSKPVFTCAMDMT